MKKLLASFLCFSLICGLGLSSIGCKKPEDKKAPAEKKDDKKDDKKA